MEEPVECEIWLKVDGDGIYSVADETGTLHEPDSDVAPVTVVKLTVKVPLPKSREATVVLSPVAEPKITITAN